MLFKNYIIETQANGAVYVMVNKNYAIRSCKSVIAAMDFINSLETK